MDRVDLSEIDRLMTVPQDVPQASRRRPQHPSGWEPGVDTERGVIVHRSASETPPEDWSEILAELKLDPARWEVVSDRVHVRTWDAAIGAGETTRFYYYKADVRPRARDDAAVDIEELAARITRHRFRRPEPTDVTEALVVCLADWQAGPNPEALTVRVLRTIDLVADRLRRTRPDVLYVVGMGDMIEGCDGHYAMQTYATGAGGLNGRRDQEKLVRRLLVKALEVWARRVPRMVVGAVPGNHGENRKDGKAFTSFEDNADLAVFEQAAEILAANPDTYGHVKFVLPDGDMSLTLDVAGTTVGFIHGHQARRGGSTPHQKLVTWWKAKQHAQHRIGDADVLVSGHYHHLCVVQEGPRTWMQCPALDEGSRWFEEGGGGRSPSGTLTFAVGPTGWHSMQVLS